MKNLKKSVLIYSIYILSFVGILICIYLLYAHFADVSVACPRVGIIDCANVLTSQYSSILGIPVPFFGMAFFILMSVFTFLKKELYLLVLSILGVLSVMYLVYVEFALIHSVCLWCSSIHVITLLLFFISVYLFLNKILTS